MNRMSELGLDIDLTTDKEANHYWMESRRPKFISDIDEMSTKIKTLKFPQYMNGSDSDYLSDEEITRSITSDQLR